MKKILTSPAPYAGWAILVVASLSAAYFADPYIFGFTTLGLAWLTGAVALVGLAVCVSSKTTPTATRVVIISCLLVAAAAIAAALAVLGTFHWA